MTQILKNSQWDVFNALRTRMSRNGLAMMPTAAKFPQSAQVVALNGGMEFDIIAFEAVRSGEPPIVPAPATTNSNRVYLRGEQTAPFPIPEMNGVKSYAIRGWYIWGILAPEGLEADFMIGNLPFPGLDQDERIPAVYFASNLINQNITRTVGSKSIPTESSDIQSILRYAIGGNG